jgi:cobalt-zinc-cadmium efflux system membrane fusion protein
MLDYEPSRFAQLAPRAPGTIWKVYKQMGDRVVRGELLALIESAEVGRAKADFMQSLTQVDVRQQVLRRLQTAGGSVPEGTLREAESALREARIRLFTDQQRLLNLGLVIRLEEAAKLPEDQLARHLRLLGLPQEVHQELNSDTLTANLLPLTAPFAGQVARHPHGGPGEVVNPAHPIYVVGDVSHLHMDLEVHLEDMAYLRVGQEVTFFPENQRGEKSETATGNLVHISPEVNEKTRSVPVHAEVENPSGRLRPNTFGTGRILVREVPGAVVVRDEALQFVLRDRSPNEGASNDSQPPEDRFYFVFVRLADSETSFQARRVFPGLSEKGVTAVKGIEPGEAVVTIGSHMLKSELLKDRISGSEE